MFGKGWLLLISVLASMFLWVNFGKNEQVNQRQMDVRLEAINEPVNLQAVGLTDKVKVIANGTNRELDALNPDQMHAQVDLSKADVGTRIYELKLINADKLPASVDLRSNVIRVTVERKATLTKTVEVETVGKRPEQFRYAGATVQPSEVTLTGPESEIKRVAKVRVLLDLAGIKQGIQKDIEVEVLTDSNRRLPNVVAEPNQVTVLPGVVAAPTTISVLVSPKWKGQPAFGFAVSSYQIRPNQVQLTGTNSVLAGISVLETEPIDLSGLKSTMTKTVRIKLPNGVHVVGSPEVTINIAVATSNTDADPAPAAPGP